ncbi:MAG: hypothetical protein MJ125_01670 [Clostridia bacterium]|jgi:hypothetical protein|nr:hypothetical protein [Clostridia bacterium]
MSRVRTIETAYQDIIKADPDTAVTKNIIKNIVKNKKINVMYSGRKAIFCLEELAEYLNCDLPD